MDPRPLLKFPVVSVGESVLRLDRLTLHLRLPQLEIGADKPLHVLMGCAYMILFKCQNLASMLPFEYSVPFFSFRPSYWARALRE